jgi:FkbM family methyltransferase
MLAKPACGFARIVSKIQEDPSGTFEKVTDRVKRTASKLRDGPLEALVEEAVWKNYGWLRVRSNPFSGKVNGISVKVYHRGTHDDIMAIWQCFYKQQYSTPKPLLMQPHHSDKVQSFYDAIVAAGRTPLILDCGANIGASVAWFRARYPASRIVAVEPAAANLALLKRNVSSDPSTEVIEGGIAAADGTMSLIDPYGSSLAYQTVSAPTASDRVAAEIKVFSIGSLLRDKPSSRFTPFILKIDIEGAESDLFPADQGGFQEFPVIILEPHDFMVPGKGITAGFFGFHASRGRDFLYGHENVFSIDFNALSDG